MTKNINSECIVFESLPSTNDKIKSLITEGLSEYSVVITKFQSAGKGQKGNSWESEKGKNLTFSLFLKPEFILAQDQFIISKIVCLGILDYLKQYSNDFCIKWPNDIYYKSLKIGGILIENSLSSNVIGSSVIGIGLNINQGKFYSDAPNPISLKNIINKDSDLDEVLNELLDNIFKYYSQLDDEENVSNINDMYLNNLFRNNGLFDYKDAEGEFKARIKGISEYGQLILCKENGQEQTYSFKEVEFII